MFYDFCPHCNQQLECDESMDNAEVTCPSCGKNFVASKESFNIDMNNKEKPEEKKETLDENKVKKEVFCSKCKRKYILSLEKKQNNVTCPFCQNFIVITPEEEKKDDLKLKILTENNSTSVWTEEKQENHFFKKVKMGKPGLYNILMGISCFHFILAFIIVAASFMITVNTNNVIFFCVGIVAGLVLAGWGFIFIACGEFVRIIFYGALSCKKIKDMMEEDRKAKENPPAEP